jgi:hypothetical protein
MTEYAVHHRLDVRKGNNAQALIHRPAEPYTSIDVKAYAMPLHQRFREHATPPSVYRGMTGLSLALMFHVLFVGLMVFKLTPRAPALIQSAEASATSVTLFKGLRSPNSGVFSAIAVDQTSARTASAQPPSAQAEPPVSQKRRDPAPRLVQASDRPLEPAPPDTLVPDLQAEAKPLHAPLIPAMVDSDAPPLSGPGDPSCALSDRAALPTGGGDAYWSKAIQSRRVRRPGRTR